MMTLTLGPLRNPEPPEDDYIECEFCGYESVAHFTEWLGNPAYDACVRDECPSNNEDEYDDEESCHCHERDRRPSIYPAAARNVAPDNNIRITVNA